MVASLKAYEEVLVPDLKKFFPKDFRSHLSSLDHLYFCIKLTLNSAYYRVRDLEAQAFYDVFQDQLQSLSMQELMGRVLETLMRTFRAQAGVILLREGRSRKLRAQSWKGIDESLAERLGP